MNNPNWDRASFKTPLSKSSNKNLLVVLFAVAIAGLGFAAYLVIKDLEAITGLLRFFAEITFLVIKTLK